MKFRKKHQEIRVEKKAPGHWSGALIQGVFREHDREDFLDSYSFAVHRRFSRGQRHDENRLSRAVQYRAEYTPEKGVGQEPFAMAPKDNRIALFLAYDIQDFCRGGGRRGKEQSQLGFVFISLCLLAP